MCCNCSINHWGNYATHACFKCRATGHFRKDCPQLKRDEKSNCPTFLATRVYNFSNADAEESPSVVAYQVSSAGTDFYMLIESRTTHSFVATKAVDRLCRPCDFSGLGFRTLLPT